MLMSLRGNPAEIVLVNIGKQIAIAIDVDDFTHQPGWVTDDFGDVELDEARRSAAKRVNGNTS